MRHMLITIGFCTIMWCAISAIEKMQSHSKMWGINEHQEKESDND